MEAHFQDKEDESWILFAVRAQKSRHGKPSAIYQNTMRTDQPNDDTRIRVRDL